MWDGRFANNAWLQECPKPLTKQVWGNALALIARRPRRARLSSTATSYDLPRDGRRLEAPVSSSPALPMACCASRSGLAARNAGAIGNGIGANAYAICARRQASGSSRRRPSRKTGSRDEILTTQNVVRTPEDVRELYPSARACASSGTARRLRRSRARACCRSGRVPDDGHAWAMVIDASVCIGCNACVVACQSENNVPVVGPEEVARGRDMHWLRIDVYDHGSADQPQAGLPAGALHALRARAVRAGLSGRGLGA